MQPTRRVSGEAQSGVTLAAWVREVMDNLAWAKSRHLITSGRVRVDQQWVFDPAYRLEPGQTVEIDPTGPRRSHAPLENDRLVYVDSYVVVVRKPAGLVTVPYKDESGRVRGDTDTLVDRTAAALRESNASNFGAKTKGKPVLGVVQRLDKDTTGLLVFARNRKAREGLQNQFRKHEIERRYLALASGLVESTSIRSYLLPNRGDGRRGSWRGVGKKPPSTAKWAVTHVFVEERLGSGDTFVSCKLDTGRQHQIRIHLSEAGHSLIGENVYIDRQPRSSRKSERLRPMLHAHILSFRHPATNRILRFEDPPPHDFQQMLQRLRTTTPSR